MSDLAKEVVVEPPGAMSGDAYCEPPVEVTGMGHFTRKNIP
jgi:hypothetical protein